MAKRRKDNRVRYTYVPSEKSLFLLENLGFVDRRNHALRKERNFNDFLNALLLDAFDRGGVRIELSWVEWQLRQAAKEHNEAFQTIDSLQKLKHELELRFEEEHHKVQKINLEVKVPW